MCTSLFLATPPLCAALCIVMGANACIKIRFSSCFQSSSSCTAPGPCATTQLPPSQPTLTETQAPTDPKRILPIKKRLFQGSYFVEMKHFRPLEFGSGPSKRRGSVEPDSPVNQSHKMQHFPGGRLSTRWVPCRSHFRGPLAWCNMVNKAVARSMHTSWPGQRDHREVSMQ